MIVDSTIQLRAPSQRLAALNLVPGQTYNITTSSSRFTGQFEGWVKDTCQMHGDFLGWRAQFRKRKASGDLSYASAFDPKTSTFVDAAPAPQQAH